MEICVNNQYGTICDDNWGDRDAAVVCAQLGFSRMSKQLNCMALAVVPVASHPHITCTDI